MPGYVAMVAAVDALGGGLAAIKIIGVASGAVDDRGGLWDGPGRFRAACRGGRRSGLRASGRPGIAVSSVTGTDMPAAALLAAAVWLLVRQADARPLARRRALRPGAWVSPPTCAPWRCRWWCFRPSTFARWVRAGSTSSPAPCWPRRSPSSCSYPGACATATATASSSSPTPRRPHRPASAPIPTPTDATAARSTGCSPKGRPMRCSRRRTGSPIAPLTSSPRAGRARAGYAVGLLAAKADRLLDHGAPAALLAALPRQRASGGERRAALLLRSSRRHRAARRWLLVRARGHDADRDRGRRRPAQLDGAIAVAAAPGADRALHAVLRRGPLSPGHRGAAAAVRRGGADWLIDLPAISAVPIARRRRGCVSKLASRRWPCCSCSSDGRACSPPATLCAIATAWRSASAPSRSQTSVRSGPRCRRPGRGRLPCVASGTGSACGARPTDGRCHHSRAFAGEYRISLRAEASAGSCAGANARRGLRRVGRAGLG